MSAPATPTPENGKRYSVPTPREISKIWALANKLYGDDARRILHDIIAARWNKTSLAKKPQDGSRPLTPYQTRSLIEYLDTGTTPGPPKPSPRQMAYLDYLFNRIGKNTDADRSHYARICGVSWPPETAREAGMLITPLKTEVKELEEKCHQKTTKA